MDHHYPSQGGPSVSNQADCSPNSTENPGHTANTLLKAMLLAPRKSDATSFIPYSDPRSTPTTAPQLPPLSSSTEMIVARALAQPNDRITHGNGSPIGWFLTDPNKLGWPASSSISPSGPNSSNSPTQTPVALSRADIQSTLTKNLAPKSGVLPSQQQSNRIEGNSLVYNSRIDSSQGETAPKSWAMGLPQAGDAIAVHAPSSLNTQPQVVTVPSASATTVTSVSHQMAFSTPPPQAPSALGRPPASARKLHSYVLPDGTITSSGKGLGRGRPGIKRGPRKSKLSSEISAEQTETVSTPTTPEMATSKPKSTPKRKREDSPSSEVGKTHLSGSNSSTPEYTPQATQTRSGRQTQKPDTFFPVSSPVAAGSPGTPTQSTTKKAQPGLSTPNGTTNNPRPTLTHPKIKRRVYRGAAREQMALCEHCLRGNGPPGNAIVFCDACNRCWHQRCHEPGIPKDVVSDAKKEWVCKECNAILRGTNKKTKGKQGRKPSSASPATANTVDASERGAFNTPSIPIGLVPGSALTRDQRVAFLSKLTKDRLIDLVLRASDLAPLLPLFEDPNPQPPPPPPAQAGVEEDEGFQSGDDDYDDYLSEHARLYPRAGSGVKLPPESADLHMLLEGPECRTFSHVIYTPTTGLASTRMLATMSTSTSTSGAATAGRR